MPPKLLAPKDLETRFWLRSVAIGGWASLVVGGAGVAYTLSTPKGRNELGILLALAVVMAMGAAALWLVPWDRFARSGTARAAGRSPGPWRSSSRSA